MAPRKVRRKGDSARPASKVRYAVVGLGYISQVAVLPAFQHAKRNSVLAGLVSDDPTKLKKLGRRYGVEDRWSYAQYAECLDSGLIDAVYIALPNDMHHEYAVSAARAGIHVLCEKPLATTEADCREMIDAARNADVKLMTAYRLHFERANMSAVEIARSGKLGDLRLFDSVFTMQVRDEDNIRLKSDAGGGTLYDIGIYCINAARYLFRAEPVEVVALSAAGEERRFAEVEEMTAAVLRFPGDRLATFSCSFGASDVSAYRVVGTKGSLQLDPAYEYAEELRRIETLNGRTREKVFPVRDQFAPELLYFSDCVLKDKQPEPSGEEGLADVRVIEALYRSARRGGQPVVLSDFRREARPSLKQEIRRPPVRKPQMVHAQAPSSG